MSALAAAALVLSGITIGISLMTILILTVGAKR